MDPYLVPIVHLQVLLHQRVLQFDMWDVTPSDLYDWNELKQSIIQYGLRNSLLVAPMPTASTSQILGNNECFEPFTIYILDVS